MKKGFAVQLVESNQPLEDILIPAKRRQGYKEGESPVVPIYFIRYVGVAGLDSSHQNLYYNQLYQLNDRLSKHPSGYIKLESPVSMPNNDEIQFAVQQISKGRPVASHSLKELIVSQVLGSGALQVFRSSALNENVRGAFEQVMDLYMRNERNINESKAENFAIKMMVWLKRYQATLCKESTLSDTPKVLFYGNIKTHEVYFLTLLALTGCDVLFVHSDKNQDKPFEEADRLNQYTKRVELSDSLPLEAFPVTERAIQKSTVAYNASKEIQSVLYGGDVGLFKARQYETGTTKPVTLKTTYDELKILWNEEAKIRPEFEVRDEKVYVPNLFAKVNGTQEQLSDYWKDVHDLAKAESTVLYKQVPFSTVRYSKQEMYSTAFLFNQEGFVNKEVLYKSPVYKLQYLKVTIQDFIVSKINELIASKLFNQEMDEKLRLKILMTIITMDNQLLRLVESFDYTGKVPKIVIYDGTKSMFSEEDSILLAFFHLVGADIVIFTPTNYTNIEQWIQPHYVAVHQLPSVQFDMDYQEKNVLVKTKNNVEAIKVEHIVVVGAVIGVVSFVVQLFF